MCDEHRSILEAYAEGVNAYSGRTSPSQISLEYAILPLQNSDTRSSPGPRSTRLTWAKVMSWDLSWNMLQEIDRATLSADLPVERIDQLYPDYPEDHPVIVPTDQAIAPHDPTITISAAAVERSSRRGASPIGLGPDRRRFRRHRLQQLGDRWFPHRVRAPDPGQRPSSRNPDALDLVPERAPLPGDHGPTARISCGLLLRRDPGCGHWAQRPHRLGRHQRVGGHSGPLHREDQPRRSGSVRVPRRVGGRRAPTRDHRRRRG